MQLTDKQQKLFNDNFNQDAFDDIKSIVNKAITDSHSFDDLWSNLQNFDCDVEFEDNVTIILCDAELDRSHMETSADYVGVGFIIKWFDETNTGKIDKVSLCSTETSSDYVADLLCYIDPNSCEVIEWVDGEESGLDIDDKQ